MMEGFTNQTIIIQEREMQVSKCISIDSLSKCVVIEFLVNLTEQKIDPDKMECVRSLLDEFSQSSLDKSLVKYTDYRIIRNSKYVKFEIAFEEVGIPLGQMDKFDKAIVFKDLRTHCINLILTLSFLKVRLVLNNKWVIPQNILFNYETFNLNISNFIVLDVQQDFCKPDNNLKKNKKKQSNKIFISFNNLENNKGNISDTKKVSLKDKKFKLLYPIESIKSVREKGFLPSNKCPYIGPFLNFLVEFYQSFEKLSTNDLIYNSDEIKNGELNAIKRFHAKYVKLLNANPNLQIEELISDKYFSVESFQTIYENFILLHTEQRETELLESGF